MRGCATDRANLHEVISRAGVDCQSEIHRLENLTAFEAIHPKVSDARDGDQVGAASAVESRQHPPRLEGFDRGRYAGPVGWIDGDGDGEWAIALKCAQVSADGTVAAYAGCGIVHDSVPADELAETDMKFRPIVEAFGG